MIVSKMPARNNAKPAESSRMTLGAVTRGAGTSPMRVLIYGVGGVGKTTFASEFPAPIFIDTQDGTARLNATRFPRPESWSDVLAAVDVLRDETHEYKTMVIDLLDDIESLIWAHVCARDGQDSIEGYGYGKGYKVAMVEWRLFLSRLEGLRSIKGMNVVLSAHAAIKPFKNPEGEDYDRYGLILHDGASSLIRGWCDTVLFARHETQVKVDKKKRVRGISTGARVMQTVESAACYAKNRDGLPDVMPLDYAEFHAATISKTPALAVDLLAEIARLSDGLDDATRRKVESATLECNGEPARLVRVLNRLMEITGNKE